MSRTNTRREPAEDVVRRVLEPGEERLWTGRPNVDLMTGHLRGGGSSVIKSLGGVVLTLVLLAAVDYFFLDGQLGFFLGGQLGFAIPRSIEDVRALFEDGAGLPLLAVVGVVAFALFGRGFALFARGKGWDAVGSYVRWVENQTYAITDRRLLILEGDEIAWEFGPEDFGEPRIRERGKGHADVEFREVPRHGRSGRKIHRDRRRIAFKALPNAEEIKRRIEEWRQSHREREEREAKSFLDGPASPRDRAGTAEGIRTISNPEYGVTVHLPESWAVEVRRRRKAYGTVFFDREKWQSPDSLPDWNVLRARGDFLSSFEIHLDRTKKLVTPYQKALNSSLVNALAGKLVDSDGGVRRGRFEGYSITREHVEHSHDQSRSDIDRPALMRHLMLHNGRMQIGIVMIWPEDSELLRQTLDKILQTLRVD